MNQFLVMGITKKKFSGFNDSETFTQVPDSFFRHLLNEIADLDELKVTLYALWCFEHMEGQVRFLNKEDFCKIIPDPTNALHRAVQRGSLLQVTKNELSLYFLNSPRGRATAESFSQGKLNSFEKLAHSEPSLERPNIYRLYEENIGPLTPMIADALRDAEQTHPLEWITEAIDISVKSNKRNWKYVEAILRRWKEEGHAKKQDRRDTQEDGRRYIEGEYADFIDH
jgi:DNA replication protein